MLTKELHRGKVEATLRFTPTDKTLGEIKINEAMVKKLAGASDLVQLYFPSAQIDFISILSWPGVAEVAEPDTKAAATEALVLLRQAIVDLRQMRQKEGKHIQKYIEQRLQNISALATEVSDRMPQLLQVEKTRLKLKVAELSSNWTRNG